MNSLRNCLVDFLSISPRNRLNEGPITYATQTKIILYLWFLLTISFAILNTIVFTYPYWIGNTHFPIDSSIQELNVENINFDDLIFSKDYKAHFGLFRYCLKDLIKRNIKNLSDIVSVEIDTNGIFSEETFYFRCSGHWSESINIYFRISTYLVGFSCVVGILCVAICFLIVFTYPQFILYVCSCLQLLIGRNLLRINEIFCY